MGSVRAVADAADILLKWTLMLSEDDTKFVRDRICIPLDRDGLVEPVEFVEHLAENGFAPIAAAFRRSLEAVLSTATVPYQLTLAGVYDLRWQQLATAERIRARNLIDKGTPHEEAMVTALQIAGEKMTSELDTQPDLFADRVLDNLLRALKRPDFADGAAELLRQCSVLSWSALEVLAQDTFIELLNAKPILMSRLFEDENTKKLFQLKAIAIETLVEHGFDLSASMGDVLIRLRAIDSIPVMRATFSALLPNAHMLREAFDNKVLWILNQRRHLIVHKRGAVDQEYLDKTGEAHEVGAQLVITPSELEVYLRVVSAAGSELLRNAAEL